MYVHPNNNLIYRYYPDMEEKVLTHIAKHPSDLYVPVRTAPGIVEFMDPKVNKGVGLTKLSENNAIPMAEIMAFGDMDNDVEMVHTAGWGVCLQNGSEKTKKSANAITEYPCWEDGVGRYLMDHWFKKYE